jgi:hypothetical protein
MEKFLLIIREDLVKLGKESPKERNGNIAVMAKWVESMAEEGNYLSSHPLWSTGTYVSKDQVLSDGPFLESKEGVSGYIVISAENIRQATAYAPECRSCSQAKR